MNRRSALTVALVLPALLVVAGLVMCGCGSPPPDIDSADVVTFRIGAGPIVQASPTLPAPARASLHRLVGAYNDARSARWEGDTTPPLWVTLQVADGTKITIWFSTQFPKNCAEVGVLAPGADRFMDYRIKSPDLLPALLELAGGSIDWDRLNQ